MGLGQKITAENVGRFEASPKIGKDRCHLSKVVAAGRER